MYLEKNAQALLDAVPASQMLLARVRQTPPAEEITLHETPEGDYALHYRGCWLHDPEGAVREADRVILEHCRPAPGRPHLILGIGLGYLPDETLRFSSGQVVVFEPDVALLRFTLENVDLSDCLETGRLQIADNVPDLLEMIRPYIVPEDPMDIMTTPGYAALMADGIPALMEALAGLTEERIRDYRTARHFHLQWIEYFFRNLPKFPDVSLWRDEIASQTNRPALIIGRGPSLDAAMADVRKFSDRMILIAVGGALRLLHAAGVTPDYAVFYDANGMSEQLHGLPAEWLRNIRFLLSAFTDPCCFEAPARSRTLLFPENGEPFAEWLQMADTIPEQRPPRLLEGGGTVSLIALQAALDMGCDPIVLIGQDLAFPGEQAYAGGIPLKRDAQGRMALEASATLYARPEAMDFVTGQNGEPLPALKAYGGFIRHFERIARRNAGTEKPVRLINASIGGARIEGYDTFPLHALLEILPGSEKPDIPECAPSGFRAEALAFALTALRRDVEEAIALHESVLASDGPEAEDGSFPGRTLYDFLNAHPLISHFLMMEMMDVQRRYNPKALTHEEIQVNRECLRASDRNCRDLLKETILPWIREAEARVTRVAHSFDSSA